MSTSMADSQVAIHPPDVHNPPIIFDLEQFMGTWHVTHSTLPLWKSRKDVTITYTLKDTQSSPNTLQFDDIVEYRSKSDPPSSTRTRIPPPRTRYKWRGKGWLMVASSRWQILGCSSDTSPTAASAWALTYFEKTLFTPAGLDIYARTAHGLPDALVQDIINKAKALDGDVGSLAEKFFEVERTLPATTGMSRIAKRDIDFLTSKLPEASNPENTLHI
ncbi:hypothetical protein A0H81_11926 [Grifola frondosa]|uniref:Lipocalin/cytosolic fatty-acid binding domain-containing protein n=1 Tax=Grifola frondosa TaxID=5627 RepID=A0A1C7LU94_GRIFR|nr:hypothetical protein A0H81_11926 [Grifola frondosa]